jgi:dinuclear metal center YbgI/SA1388 family protein
MKLNRVIDVLERIAPLSLAQSWDNVGLLIGDAQSEVHSILLTIDTTQAVVAEAKQKKADLIVSYHPILFEGAKRLTTKGTHAQVVDLIQNRMALYSFHTALDVVKGGVNDALAESIGIQDPQPIGDFQEDPDGPAYKLITFIPVNQVDDVAEALYQAGAGHIGHYSHCGFRISGTGTFLPLDGSNPTIGAQGRLERVEEIRLETAVRRDKIQAVIAALKQAHPYETPAFDVFRHHDLEQRLGMGRWGRLHPAVNLDTLFQRIKANIGAKTVGLIGPRQKKYHSAAVCAGACGKIIDQVIAHGCDLYVTGELRHHTALAAQEAGLTCLCLSHSVSERFVLKKVAQQLKKQLTHVKIHVSRKDRDPMEWMPL